MDVNDWLVRWASDNMYDAYVDSAASMEQAATDCRSAAEEAGISLSSLDRPRMAILWHTFETICETSEIIK